MFSLEDFLSENPFSVTSVPAYCDSSQPEPTQDPLPIFDLKTYLNKMDFATKLQQIDPDTAILNYLLPVNMSKMKIERSLFHCCLFYQD